MAGVPVEKRVLKLMKQAGGFIQQQVARDPRRRKRIHRRVIQRCNDSVNRCVNELIARTGNAFS